MACRERRCVAETRFIVSRAIACARDNCGGGENCGGGGGAATVTPVPLGSVAPGWAVGLDLGIFRGLAGALLRSRPSRASTSCTCHVGGGLVWRGACCGYGAGFW